jgi:hypothetical protein
MMEKNMTDQGAQQGGGPRQSDMAAPGGSSGTGGYGNDQQSQDQGQQTGAAGHDEQQSRGERFDEEQGGGRGAESISDDAVAQVGGGEASFDQHTDRNALSQAADALLGDGDSEQSRAEFESDAPS